MNVALPIVFIGPMAAGKSTISAAVARKLGVRQVPFDAVRFYYYLKYGDFSFERQLDLPDFAAVTQYWKPYEIDAAERIFIDFPDAVIDFGAGQAHYTDPLRIQRLQAAFQNLPNVFLLLPDEDLDRAEAICCARDVTLFGFLGVYTADVGAKSSASARTCRSRSHK